MSPLSLLRRPVPDAEAFDAVYREQHRKVLRFLARRTFDPELAMDLMAETFAQAFIGRRTFRGSTPEQELAWLLGIAHNLLHQHWRTGQAETRALTRLGLEPPVLEDEDLQRIVDLADLSTIGEAIRAGLTDLPEDQREAVRMRVVDELAYPTIAARLGVTETTVRARVSRGLRALADAIEHPSVATR